MFFEDKEVGILSNIPGKNIRLRRFIIRVGDNFWLLNECKEVVAEGYCLVHDNNFNAPLNQDTIEAFASCAIEYLSPSIKEWVTIEQAMLNKQGSVKMVLA